MKQEYWIVIAEDETYHQTPPAEGAENLHRVGLPIVGGPFDTYAEADRNSVGQHQMPVSLPKGAVEGWEE